MLKAGIHIEWVIHWLKLVAAGTGLEASGQENDRSPVFPHFKSDIHRRDRRYCELFLKKDPLAQTNTDVLTKARFHAYTHTVSPTLSQTHPHTQVVLGAVPFRNLLGGKQRGEANFGRQPEIGVQVQENKATIAPCVHSHGK